MSRSTSHNGDLEHLSHQSKKKPCCKKSKLYFHFGPLVELFSFALRFLCVPVLPALGLLAELEPLVLAVAVTLLAATRVTLALPTMLAAECLGSESSAFWVLAVAWDSSAVLNFSFHSRISGFIPRFSCFWATDPNSSAQLTLDVAAWPGWPICFDSSRECASCRHAPEVRGCHSLFTCVFFCC